VEGREHDSLGCAFLFVSQGEIHFGRNLAAAIEARVQGAGFQGSPEEEASGEKQSEGERDLRHDQEMTRSKETVEPSDMGRFADLLLEIIHQIGPRCLQSWSQTEKQCGEETDEKGDGEDGDIGA
jgi:hypothetical protein